MQLTRVPARLSNHQSAINIVLQDTNIKSRRILPKHKPATLPLIVEIPGIGSHWPNRTTVAIASTFFPSLNGPTMHTHFVHMTRPLVPPTGPGMYDPR
jgi:hypothetical protein